MNITVYLGASDGGNAKLGEAACELGTWIGRSGNSLVYGGSKVGLMGKLAQSALAAGADVTGVEPQFFIDQDAQLDGLTRLIVTQNMAERKAKMIELGDAFVALPGGTGTLEEITEIMSRAALELSDAPCIICNLDGFYDSLKALLDHMVQTGMTTPERLANITFANSIAEVEQVLS